MANLLMDPAQRHHHSRPILREIEEELEDGVKEWVHVFEGGLLRYETKVSGEKRDWAFGIHELISGFYIWRGAVVELFATAMFTFFSMLSIVSAVSYGYSPAIGWIAFVNGAFIVLLIFSAGAVSGAHFNPLITFSTFLTGLTSLPRAVLYILAQIAGATIGGAMVDAVIDSEIEDTIGVGACHVGDYNQGAALLVEVVFDFILLFVAYGVALDPIQGQVFGPVLAPFLLGLVVMINIFVSAGIAEAKGYSGASMNPSRCFGAAVASGDWDGQWVYWVGAIICSIIYAIFYMLVPPSHKAPILGCCNQLKSQFVKKSK